MKSGAPSTLGFAVVSLFIGGHGLLFFGNSETPGLLKRERQPPPTMRDYGIDPP
jgi:hypothetical protein